MKKLTLFSIAIGFTVSSIAQKQINNFDKSRNSNAVVNAELLNKGVLTNVKIISGVYCFYE